jgi:hypothetical protein
METWQCIFSKLLGENPQISVEETPRYGDYMTVSTSIYPNAPPWCWNMNPNISPKKSSFFGKYTSTMVRIWVNEP